MTICNLDMTYKHLFEVQWPSALSGFAKKYDRLLAITTYNIDQKIAIEF